MKIIDNLKLSAIDYESVGLFLHEAIDKNQVAILTTELLRDEISRKLRIPEDAEISRLFSRLEQSIRDSGLYVQDAKRKLSTSKRAYENET